MKTSAGLLRNLQVDWCHQVHASVLLFHSLYGEVRLAHQPQLMATMALYFSSTKNWKHMRTISTCFIFWNNCKYFSFFGRNVPVHFTRAARKLILSSQMAPPVGQMKHWRIIIFIYSNIFTAFLFSSSFFFQLLISKPYFTNQSLTVNIIQNALITSVVFTYNVCYMNTHLIQNKRILVLHYYTLYY